MKNYVHKAIILLPNHRSLVAGPVFHSRSVAGLLRKIEECFELEEGVFRDEETAIRYFKDNYSADVEFFLVAA